MPETPYHIIPSAPFLKAARRLAKRYRSLAKDLQVLEDSLLENPYQGVDMGNGFRKVRLQNSDKNKGKSGGYRVVTYLVQHDGSRLNIYLVTIWDKSEMENMSISEIRQIFEEAGMPETLE